LTALLSRFGLLLWALATVVVGGALMVLHDGVLPVQPLAAAAPTPRWTALHVLAAKCPCSMRVLNHLVERGPLPTLDERVALVDGTPALADRLTARGFQVDVVTAEQLETRYGGIAAPVLQLRRPDGTVAYQGGYAARANLPADDVRLIAAAQAGQPAAPYPAFGCAVSRKLQDQMDPFRLKYAAWRQ
jgi:hypothetical protein